MSRKQLGPRLACTWMGDNSRVGLGCCCGCKFGKIPAAEKRGLQYMPLGKIEVQNKRNLSFIPNLISRRHDQKHAYGDDSPEEGGGRGGPGDEVEGEGEQGTAAQLLAGAGGGVDQQEQAQQGRHQQAHVIRLENKVPQLKHLKHRLSVVCTPDK